MELRTADSILQNLNQIVTEKQSLSPQHWVDAALFLNILIGDENDKLYLLKQQVAQEKARLLIESKSVAEATVKIEASDLYRNMKIQEAKIEQIQEMIRLGKLQARLVNDEIKNY